MGTVRTLLEGIREFLSPRAPRRVRRIRGAIVLGLALIAAVFAVRGCGSTEPRSGEQAAGEPERRAQRIASGLSRSQLVGQRLLLSFDGTVLTPDITERLRSGRAAGVVLFERNIGGDAALRRLTRRIQSLSRRSPVRAPAVIAIDQEGGPVRRIDGPPELGAAEMASLGTDAIAAEGAATGSLLDEHGINVNLAPVVDLGRPGSALEDEGRTFGLEPDRVIAAARAFVAGLEAHDVAATAKHYPGFGSAPSNTDDARTVISRSPAEIRADEEPFAALSSDGIDLIMLSTAIYTDLDSRPAALSRAVERRLRTRVGFEGVTITDALDTPALEAFAPTGRVAIEAAEAGIDLLIHAQSTTASILAEEAILGAVRDGEISRRSLERSAVRVIALRRSLPG